MALPQVLIKSFLIFIVLAIFISCDQTVKHAGFSHTKNEPIHQQVFKLLDPTNTNVDFQNTLNEGLNTNILMYEYFYNGGGVGVGDLNGDGHLDLYFTSNMGDNKLYLNDTKIDADKTTITYKDITQSSGASGRSGPWKTGVNIIDINGDDKLDIYLCYSGAMPQEKRKNQLFINQGNDKNNAPFFLDKASQYGVDHSSFSNQSYFFDYDRDGDLDMLLLNHNPKNLPVLNEVKSKKLLEQDDPYRGVRLLENRNNRFVDVTISSGISSSSLTYGLGIAISDINNDGWPDFYISNDYAVPDYLYINNGNGTFKNSIKTSTSHISQFSMGNDISDLNNDGYPDIVTLDMLPESLKRQKSLVAPDDYSKFDLNIRSGFHKQYMRNMLQLNNGDGSFSEIGQYAGISNTDWSWAPLAADYNNNGYKDLYVTNGYNRDYTNLDFINYMESFVAEKGRLKREDVLEIIKNMPASDVSNYMFEGHKNVRFLDMTREWGLSQVANSNGASYADLDNDGDLDLIVNNINKTAFIYENLSNKEEHLAYLEVVLEGLGMNTQGIGAKVSVYCEDQIFLNEQYPARGYLSSVSDVLHIGLGTIERIDSLIVVWPSGKIQKLENVDISSRISLTEEAADVVNINSDLKNQIFREIENGIKYVNPILEKRDFDRQLLLPRQLSNIGPAMSKGDINNDGLEDVFVGGAAGQSAQLFVQTSAGFFEKSASVDFEESKASHDSDAVIFDANNDGYNDVYVVSGGYHDFSIHDSRLKDRLYINQKDGTFKEGLTSIPSTAESGSSVTLIDINSDGYKDLFIGGRVVPGRYPEPPKSSVLINDGEGNFIDKTADVAPQLEYYGMITDALSIDLNNDLKDDLVVVGEWMGIGIFINDDGHLKYESSNYFDQEYSGLWHQIDTGDFNMDGRLDIVVGNIGLNSQLKASDEAPLELMYGDMDENGSVDPILIVSEEGFQYPFITRDELLKQLPKLKSSYPSYERYSTAKVEDIFSKSDLKSADKLKVTELESSFFLRNEDGGFHKLELPKEVQYAPVSAISIFDFDGDGYLDMLLCGNDRSYKLRLGQIDANRGLLLKGLGDGSFQTIPNRVSGLNLSGDVKSILQIDQTFLFGINQSDLVIFEKSNLENN